MIEIGESILEKLEILYVMNDLKPCCRVKMYQEKFFKYRRFCKENRLQLEISNFKILPIIDKGNFANSGTRIRPTDKGGYHYAFISKHNPHRAKQADEIGDNRTLGKLLGYPDCCIEYFENNKHLIDPILPGTGTKIQDFRNNYYLRYFDIALIDHFPCSHDCTYSIEQAQKRLKFLKNNHPIIAEKFENELNSLILHSKKEVSYSKDYKILDNSIKLSNLRSTGETRLSTVEFNENMLKYPNMQFTIYGKI